MSASAAAQSMYIRVKRKKTTIFLVVEPTDTVLEVKQKLQALIDKVGCAAVDALTWPGSFSASSHKQRPSAST